MRCALLALGATVLVREETGVEEGKPPPGEQMCCCDATEPDKYLCVDAHDEWGDAMVPVTKGSRTDNPFGGQLKLSPEKRSLIVTTEVLGECSDGAAHFFEKPESRTSPVEVTQQSTNVHPRTYAVKSGTYKSKDPHVVVADVVYKHVNTKEFKKYASFFAGEFGEGEQVCSRYVSVPEVSIVQKSVKRQGGKDAKAGALATDNPFAAADNPFAAANTPLTAQRGVAAVNASSYKYGLWTANTICTMKKTCIEWSFRYACGFNKPVGELYKRVGRLGKCMPADKKGECPMKNHYHRRKTGHFGYGGWRFCDCLEKLDEAFPTTAAWTQRSGGNGKCIL